MSENAELVRRIVEAFNQGDLEAALESFDPDIALRLDPRWPENRSRFGIEAVRSFFEELTATLGYGDSAIEEIVDLGDRVVIRLRVRYHGQRSTVEDEAVFTQVITLRRQKVVLMEYFLDFDEALKALGPA